MADNNRNQDDNRVSEVDAHINKGKELINHRKYSDAKEEFDSAIRLDPKKAVAYCARGIILHELGKHEDAIKEFDIAIKLDPKYVAAYRNKGLELKGLGRYVDAIKEYDTAIKFNSSDAALYNDKGNILDKIGKHEDAIKEYDTAIKINPNYAIAYCNKGIALEGLYRYEDAIKEFDIAIKLDPNNSQNVRDSALKYMKDSKERRTLKAKPERSYKLTLAIGVVLFLIMIILFIREIGMFTKSPLIGQILVVLDGLFLILPLLLFIIGLLVYLCADLLSIETRKNFKSYGLGSMFRAGKSAIIFFILFIIVWGIVVFVVH
jgi:tetratricopeptide (TPR) repeat protein